MNIREPLSADDLRKEIELMQHIIVTDSYAVKRCFKDEEFRKTGELIYLESWNLSDPIKTMVCKFGYDITNRTLLDLMDAYDEEHEDEVPDNEG